MTKDGRTSWAFSEAQMSIFPELRYFVDGQAPAEDLEAYLDFQRGWPTWVAVGTSVVTAPALTLLLHRGMNVGLWVTVAVVIGVQLLISWFLLGILFPSMRRRQIRAVLRRRLNASGIYPCRMCAYDLRGTPQRCPECGTHVTEAGDDEDRSGEESST